MLASLSSSPMSSLSSSLQGSLGGGYISPDAFIYQQQMQALGTQPPKQENIGYTISNCIFHDGLEIKGSKIAEKNRRLTMMENVKGYVEKHKDMLFTLGLVILVDHFLFKGKLRERIQTTIEGALKKVEDKFHQEEK